MDAEERQSRLWWVAVGAATLAGLALRLAAAQGGLWTDEAWSVIYAAQARDAVGVFLRINHDNNHHLYSLWLQAIGSDASPMLVARLPAILAGTLCVPMAALVVARRSAWAGVGCRNPVRGVADDGQLRLRSPRLFADAARDAGISVACRRGGRGPRAGGNAVVAGADRGARHAVANDDGGAGRAGRLVDLSRAPGGARPGRGDATQRSADDAGTARHRRGCGCWSSPRRPRARRGCSLAATSRSAGANSQRG